MASFIPLREVNPSGKTVVMRVDFNVPMHAGHVTDATRIERVLPTIRWLAERGAKVVLLSHFDRPRGRYEPTMSLAPLVDELQKFLPGIPVRFGVDCVGTPAREAIAVLPEGGVALLENLRFHEEEESNGAEFGKALAALGDMYVNEAFSCSHRAHASVVGIPRHLPTYAGFAMQEEIEMFERLLASPGRPVGAVVGGSKVSTKLALLEHLVSKMDRLIIGGAMANTFLAAQGHSVGVSRQEKEMHGIARKVLSEAEAKGCALLLPEDVVVASALEPHAPCRVLSVDAVPEDAMILDIGPQTLEKLAGCIRECRTLLWNGPLGAFETAPFDASTVQLARVVARRTREGALYSVAGGGDTVAALGHAGLREEFSYLSTAGGAFLEWLEGRVLPGIAALRRES